MFEFAWPWMALLLLLPLAVRRFWLKPANEENALTEGQQTTLLHPSLAHLQEAFQTRSPRLPLATRLHQILLWLLWLTLVLALMRPQWLEPYTENRTAGYDLMLAVDTSRSMTAEDFTVHGREVSRLSVLKGIMGKFVDGRVGDRIGLIIFGDTSYVLSPLTFDRNAIHQLLDGIVPTLAGGGTAIGDGIGLGIKKLRERPEGSRVLILVTDGKNETGTIPPLKAAQLAKQEGIRIYTIGVGSTKNRIRLLSPDLRTYEIATGLAIDEETLQQIAETTGGAYFRATDTAALEKVYQRIDELEKSEAESRTIFIPQPLFHWPLGAALLLLLSLGLFPEGRRRQLRGGGYA
ncbi:VWA domain-containing protein [Candidatus Endoriftia persephonae]|jgi:Ca-activated chloride channel family protein|uniref:Aerotolerance-related membrane protein BatA n=2 Tax=Gammaproteobacteria TaxID=1236 RepID=G2FIX1_9GAMM|nr:VWA domain-containing protein [Candidatus Endoriftia persephone]EGW53241.1 aerotolerance-related membrane protein BatA [endosymbiont of Tevnia jerichonana (vent Tica)]USF86814.1 VWA domain-containing protein [Candidatus Endoriftia persephone]